MSWRATAFIKPLTSHTDGTPLTAREKLILFVLADSHNDDYDCAWPSIGKAAAASLTSRSRFIELVSRMEKRGTIRVSRKEGFSNRYFFPGLPVRESDPPPKRPSENRTPPVRQLSDPTRPTAIGPKPLESLQGTDIAAPTPHINLVLRAIEESHRTGESADEIIRQVKSGERQL